MEYATGLGVYLVLNGRLNFDWSFEKMKLDMTPHRMFSVVNVLLKR